MKVLIVDDSELLQDRLAKLFSDIDDLEIVGNALNTFEGKKLMYELNPDILISDIRMPGGGGFELLWYSKVKFPKTTVCIYTNYAYVQYKDKSLDLGADYFFHKTTESEKLYETVKEIVNNNQYANEQVA